jgi:predicted restriction endonuclease
MEQKQFESWIRQEQPQITDIQRYPKTITTISNHLKKNRFENYDLYSLRTAEEAKILKKAYFDISEYFDLNNRGNHMYSRAFDLFIQFLAAENQVDPIVADIQNIMKQKNIESTERTSLIQSRLGQGKFRDSLIQLWGGCSVTGYSFTSLLVASHIKPWNKSDNRERLDPYNGFLLLPNIDKIFDLGFITFNYSGEIIIGKKLSEHKIIGISPEMKINILDQHKPYLEYHRAKVYRNI